MSTITLTNLTPHSGKSYFVVATKSNMSSWQTSTKHPNDGSTGSTKITPAASGEATLMSKATPTLDPTHKYYISFQVMSETAISTSFDWYWPIAEPYAAKLSASLAANTWVRLSAVFTRASFSPDSYQFRWDYNNGDSLTPVYLSSTMFFDITEAFGAGNEPDKEWLDANITTFGDTLAVEYSDNIVWTPPDGWEEKTGAHVSFTTPCDSTFTGKLKISGGGLYSIVDACGNTMNGRSGLFASDAVLDLILDCDNKKAYIQNPATPRIQYGTVSVSFGTTATTATVTFSSAFAAKPIVICQQVFDSINCRVEPENTSETGFTITIPALTSSGTRDVMWVAIGT